MTQRSIFDEQVAAAVKNIHVHHGDWREVEASWPRPYALISDPPFGIDYRSNFKGNNQHTKRFNYRHTPDKIQGDEDTRERDEILELGHWQLAAIFGPGGVKLLRVPPWGSPRALLTLDKGAGAGMGDITLPWKPNTGSVAIYGQGWKGHRDSSVLRGRVLAFSRDSINNGRRHPHEKPLNVVYDIVQKVPKDIPVVDPFLGSGTTAEACALLGRTFYGAEIDPQYFDTISQSLSSLR